MDGHSEVGPVASVVAEPEPSFVAAPVVKADETLVERRDFEVGEGLEESSGEGNKGEIMVGLVDSEVIDVVSRDHENCNLGEDGLGKNCDVSADSTSGNHETWNPGIVAFSGSSSVMLEAERVQQEAATEESLNDENVRVHEVVHTAEPSVLDDANHTSSKQVIETDGEQQQEVAVVFHESKLSFKDEIVVDQEVVETAELIEADEVQYEVREEGVTLLEDKSSSFEDEIVSVHDTVGTAAELSVSDNANHASGSCPMIPEEDGVLHKEVGEEDVTMIQDKTFRFENEIPDVHDAVETSSRLSVPDDSGHTSASCPLVLETEHGVVREEDVATHEEKTSSFKDSIRDAHDTVEAVSVITAPDNANDTSASCPLKLEADGVQHGVVKEDIFVILQGKTSSSNVETSELSVPDNVDHTSASSPLMLETDGVRHEIVREEGKHDNVSSSKDKILHAHEMSQTASDAIVDNASHASFDHHNNSAKDIRDNVEVIPAEEGTQSTIAVSESNVADQSLLLYNGEQVMNNSQIIDPNGTHDKWDGNLISCLRHDVSEGEVAAVDCTISSSNDQKDANVGLHCLVEDRKEVCGESNPDFSCQHNSHIDNASDMDLVTECDFSGGPSQVIEKKEVPGSPVEFVVEFNDKNRKPCSLENNLGMKQETSCSNDIGEDTAPESTYHLSVIDQGDWIGMDFDVTIDLKEEATGIDDPMEDICYTANTGDFSTEPAKGDEELAHSDLKMLEMHEQLATGDSEVVAAEEAGNFGEFSDGSTFQQENEKLGTGDVVGGKEEEEEEEEGAMVENTVSFGEQVTSTVACSVKSQEAIVKGEESIAGKNPESALEMPDSSRFVSAVIIANKIGLECQGNDKACAESTLVLSNSPVQNEKEGEIAQANGTICHELLGDDRECAEAAFDSQNSHVQTSAGIVGEGNKDSVLLDGRQKGNLSAGIHEAETTGISISEAASSAEIPDQAIIGEGEDSKTISVEKLPDVLPEAPSVEGQTGLVSAEQYADGQVDAIEQPMAIEGHSSEMDQIEIVEEAKVQSSGPLSMLQSGYLGPPESDVKFSVSDLVWGKVRSHPWWPGQIFDPSDASDRATKHVKKGSFLVAYFGDRTFAWNDASVLKPFRPHFSQIEKQSKSEVFHVAVNSALNEVSRRIELGLSCSCTPRDVYEKIECQVVENAGIREESSRRYGVDRTSGAALFEPDKLLGHIRVLALGPLTSCDRLELALAKAQLSAFCHFKGYREPPLYESREAFPEVDTETFSNLYDHEVTIGELIHSGTSSSHRPKESLKNSLQPKKERSLSELLWDTEFSPEEVDGMDGKSVSRPAGASSGKKRKAVDSADDGPDRRKIMYAAKVSSTLPSPKPSFKVGDCIRRVATQLTGAASSLKSSTGQQGGDALLQPCDNSPRGSAMLSTDSSAVEDMLFQLQLAARIPKKAYGFSKKAIAFFSDFRNSVVSKQAAGRSGGNRKRKASHVVAGTTEEFEFDDVNDSYWRDKAIQNYHDEQLLQDGDKNDDGLQPVVSVPAKMQKPTRRPYTKKQRPPVNCDTSADEPMEPYTKKQRPTVNYDTSEDEPMEDDEKLKQEILPTELVMSFAEGSRIPSQTSLNNIFRRFGPLKEHETEIDQESRRARVIFKRGADAEVACSSAGVFHIFGSGHVTYQLSHSPSSILRDSPHLISQGQENET